MEMLFTFDRTWIPQLLNSGSKEYTSNATIIKREVILMFTTTKDKAGGWGLGAGVGIKSTFFL